MKRGGEKLVGSRAEKLPKKVLVNSTGTNGKKNISGDDTNQDHFISKGSSGKTSKRPFGSQASNSSNIQNSYSTQNGSIYGEQGNLDDLNENEDFQDENLVKRKRRKQIKAKIKKDVKEETVVEILSSETNVKDSDKQPINQAAVQGPSEARIKHDKDSKMIQKETEISNLKGQLAKNKIRFQNLQLDLNEEHKLSTGLKKETKKLQVDLEAETQSNSALRNELDEKNSIIERMLSVLQEFGKRQIVILSQKKGKGQPSIAIGDKDMAGLATKTASCGQNSSIEKKLNDNSILTPSFKQQQEHLEKYLSNRKSDVESEIHDETSIVVHDISADKNKIHEVSNELTSTNTKPEPEEIVEGSREIPLPLDTPITRAYRKLEERNRFITSNLSKHIGSMNNTLIRRFTLDPEGNKFRCTSCNKPYSTLFNAITHERIVCRIHHASNVLDQLGIRIKSCDTCGKEFHNTSTLIIHKETHVTASRNVACPVKCGSYFHSQRSADMHYNRGYCKMSRTQKNIDCEICPKKFRSRRDLRQHVIVGHIPTSVQVYAWVNGTVIRREQIENDSVDSKKKGIWMLYGMPIYHPKHGYLLCIGRSSYWDVAVTAFRMVKKCINVLNKQNNSLILCDSCSLRKWLNEGWVALPDLAFRIGGMFIVGSMLGSKIKWYEREQNGDAYVFSPTDLNQFIEDEVGPLLQAEVDKVRHLFKPSDDVRARTRQICKDYISKGTKYILKRKVIDGPFQGPSNKKYLAFLEEHNQKYM